MNTKRFYYLMLSVCLLICGLLVLSVAAGNIIFTKQSDKLIEAKADKQVIDEQKVSLAKAKNDIKKYSDVSEISNAIVPKDKDQAKTIREINKIAGTSGISLSKIIFETSSLGQKDTTASALTQVQKVPGIDNVVSLEINIASADEIPYNRFIKFLGNLEKNRRTAHVTSISISPAESNQNNVTFSLILNAYIKPEKS